MRGHENHGIAQARSALDWLSHPVADGTPPVQSIGAVDAQLAQASSVGPHICSSIMHVCWIWAGVSIVSPGQVKRWTAVAHVARGEAAASGEPASVQAFEQSSWQVHDAPRLSVWQVHMVGRSTAEPPQGQLTVPGHVTPTDSFPQVTAVKSVAGQ